MRLDGHVCEILEAVDGVTAMQMLREQQPDLLLLDIQTAKRAGMELLVASSAWPERLVLKSARITQLVRVADIDWIESAGVHVVLHVQGREV